MNQSELVMKTAQLTGLPKKDVEHALKVAGDVIQAELAGGGEATLPGIGKLAVVTTKARTGRNPATGESIEIAAKRKPHFSAAKALKDAVAS